jgi:hypothetical protein
MCLQPKHASSGGRINAGFVPPDGFIPAAMHLTVMSPAQRDSKFIADLAAKRRGLRKAQVVGIGRTTTAHQTRLFGNGLDMFTVAEATRRRQAQQGLIDRGPALFFASMLSPRSVCGWSRCSITRPPVQPHLESTLNALGIGCK